MEDHGSAQHLIHRKPIGQHQSQRLPRRRKRRRQIPRVVRMGAPGRVQMPQCIGKRLLWRAGCRPRLRECAAQTPANHMGRFPPAVRKSTSEPAPRSRSHRTVPFRRCADAPRCRTAPQSPGACSAKSATAEWKSGMVGKNMPFVKRLQLVFLYFYANAPETVQKSAGALPPRRFAERIPCPCR